MRLGGRGGSGDGDGDKSFNEPNGEPGAGSGLTGGSEGRGERGDTHSHASPTGDGGKFSGTLHRFADVAEMVGGASIDRDGFAQRRPDGRRHRHESTLKETVIFVKYFTI